MNPNQHRFIDTPPKVCKAAKGAEVVLINPPMRMDQVYGEFSEWGSISPPTGLCYIAALLREHGHTVSIVDAEALHWDVEKTVAEVLDLTPLLVGIACKSLWMPSAALVAAALHAKRPDLPIFAGGNHVTALPERTLEENPAILGVIIGEGEITFKELVEALKNGHDWSSIAGLALRLDGKPVRTQPRARILDLDELPAPAFDLLPDLTTHYRPPLNLVDKTPAFSLLTSRGCPSKCTFCDRSVFGNRVTGHSPEYMMEIIRNLHQQYGVCYLLFDDDNLLIRKDKLFRLLDLIEESGLGIQFNCQSRVDTITEEVLIRLKQAGCRRVLFGIESGSPDILKAMQKRISTEQIIRAVNMTQSAGLMALGYFILGYPGETEETLKETVELIRKSTFDDVAVFFFTPLPGSEAYSLVVNNPENGVYQEDWAKGNSLEHVVYIPTGLNEQILKQYMDKCYSACYLRPRQVAGLLRRCPSREHFKAVTISVGRMLRKLVPL
ncbi:MAG: B12-binding domain-containing radical SAM protein [Geobacteraceae bacterium]|nr:B12-binding domain-containing radical SAM protein [Geobacteraceae bacterium]